MCKNTLKIENDNNLKLCNKQKQSKGVKINKMSKTRR